MPVFKFQSGKVGVEKKLLMYPKRRVAREKLKEQPIVDIKIFTPLMVYTRVIKIFGHLLSVGLLLYFLVYDDQHRRGLEAPDVELRAWRFHCVQKGTHFPPFQS